MPEALTDAEELCEEELQTEEDGLPEEDWELLAVEHSLADWVLLLLGLKEADPLLLPHGEEL